MNMPLLVGVLLKINSIVNPIFIVVDAENQLIFINTMFTSDEKNHTGHMGSLNPLMIIIGLALTSSGLGKSLPELLSLC